MNFAKLRQQIFKMRKRDLFPLIKLILTYIPGKLYRLFNSDVWVITEYENDARDNGYWLFKYIRETYPNKKVFYPINFECNDFNKIKSLGNYIKFGGIKHYILFWGCSKFIGTTKYYGFPYGRICEDLVQWDLHDFKNIFLNHGVARGYSSIVDAKNTNYDLIISMSEKEKEILIKANFQSSEKVKVVGFCRYDSLKNIISDKKKIVIMPTWRNWLDFRLEIDESNKEKITKQFLESKYYKSFFSLINNRSLLDFLDKNDIELIFYLHGYAQVYSDYFYSSSSRLLVASKEEYFVQDLLKISDLLITDYSSVTYDFCYMKKPMIYYQFDKDEFEEKQYAESKYFTYDKDGFGPIVDTEENLVIMIKEMYEKNFELEDEYRVRIDEFFKYDDEKNCERNYLEILNL
ncbi:CDP-glycerol glycerophosphotransferase family protein [Enterococcus caccae]|uniref:Teichoic acid biosynthesis protein B n=1 Tax=Enterococcus caccae ATCC BAA-1240 TaxID=1158612 RepID=R3WPQ5_9ENTE|nr:CDP-glycerol glycerophosphotransferase family protein [Enterococcus caccae]EOL49392.1 hypothetical protein UC7_00769 [Enterococcus caccae ATCC BAA-1240]EOT56444.1 hypothetical protein I580_03244 [Enterococcus caccae ATCC BAA-1240]OJG25251.1 hypothetical protein RU98_GL001076 [Enterococcus caccae]